MATAREYFHIDLSNTFRDLYDADYTAHGESVTFTRCTHYDYDAGVRYFSIYVPEHIHTLDVIVHHLRNMHELRAGGEITVYMELGMEGIEEKLSSKQMPFLQRLIVYTSRVVSRLERTALEEVALMQNVLLTVRDGEYSEARSRNKRPVAFICHDSRDKEPFVRELATVLQKMLLFVWYDEFSLRIGDSLRESIEKGIKECHSCILILSPNFLTNDGWTKAEFDSIYTREIIEKKNVILPIWHNVTQRMVYDFSPRLSDKVAIISSFGSAEVAKRLCSVLHPMTR